MTFSIYEALIPTLIRTLANLSEIIDKTAAQADSEGKDLKALLEARLAPDMHPFTRQVQAASDTAKGSARLAGLAVPSFPDTETTLPELKERIAKTIEFLRSLPKETFDGSEDRTIELKMPGKSFELRGADYLTSFVLPDFYFHVTTAYALLRHNGINLGKVDYLGAWYGIGATGKT